jgi:hypothetical protein
MMMISMMIMMMMMRRRRGRKWKHVPFPPRFFVALFSFARRKKNWKTRERKKQKSIAFLAFGTFYTPDTQDAQRHITRIKMDPQLLNSLPEEDKTKMVAMIETMQTRDR